MTKSLKAAADYLIASVERDGVITKSVVLAAEEMLSDLAPVAKSYKEMFVSHCAYRYELDVGL